MKMFARSLFVAYTCLAVLQTVYSEGDIVEKWRDNLLGVRKPDEVKHNKRDVIEEEDVRNAGKDITAINPPAAVTQWIPQPSVDEDEPKLAVAGEEKIANAEALLDRQNGREARGATKDTWIKLPYLNHPEPRKHDELSSSPHNVEDTPHRLPRVNFVTQGKPLQAAESRNQRDSTSRSNYGRDLRTELYPPGRGRSMDYSTFSRQSYYYPEDYQRRGYDDFYYDDMYSGRKPYYMRNRQRYDYYDDRYRTPYDRYDMYDERSDKPRRIIYYATLPDVVRSPPSVYRYPNQYRGYDDDRYYYRDRYDDYRSSNYYPRYPYSPLKKAENDGPRDLSPSETAAKEKSEAVKRQEEARKKKEDELRRSRDYRLSTSVSVSDPAKNSLYHDSLRMDNDIHRFDHPSFQAAVDDPYISRHDKK